MLGNHGAGYWGLMAAMFGATHDTNRMLKVDTYDELPNHIERPQGNAKEYFFNKDGEFSTECMLKEECVFMCFAINNKNAIRKFNKFNKTR